MDNVRGLELFNMMMAVMPFTFMISIRQVHWKDEIKTPEPREGESEQSFVSRCISYLFHEEGEQDKAHATAKCYGIYRQWKRGKKK